MKVFCWLTGGSSQQPDRDRRRPGPTSAPWPNLGFGRGHGAAQRARARAGRRPSRRSRARPRPARVGAAGPAPRSIHGAQVSRSAAVGLFAGGAQRTVATIRASTSRWPSPACYAGRLDRPAGAVQAGEEPVRRSRSPVKIRPVRLPPLAAGASPTISTARLGVAPAGDRPAPVGLVGERRPLARRATSSRQRTSRGQAEHTLTRASSSASGTSVRRAVVRRRRRGRPGCPRRAGSSGQPVPGGTGLGTAPPTTGCGRRTGSLIGRSRRRCRPGCRPRRRRARSPAPGRGCGSRSGRPRR